MREGKTDKVPDDGERRPPPVLEALLLVWVVLGLGYYYYTQGLLDLLKVLWGNFLG